jgi:fimbrial chaperone protein
MRIIPRLAAALLLLCPSLAARAATQLTPLLVEFLPGQGAATLTVTNAGEEPASYDIDIEAWSFTGDTDSLEPTEDIIASPPAVVVPPGEAQVIRLMLRRPAVEAERAYRLEINEQPSAAARARRQINFAVTYSVPVFAQPKNGAKSGRLEWGIDRATDGRLQLTGHNSGGRFVRVADLKAVNARGQQVPLKLTGKFPYVLAGQDQHWAIGADSAGLLRVTGTAQSRPFDQTISMAK